VSEPSVDDQKTGGLEPTIKWVAVLVFVVAQVGVLVLLGQSLGQRYISREAQFALVLVFAVVSHSHFYHVRCVSLQSGAELVE
jgi:hypothetical protein